jgi:hypothetical protein
LTISKPFVNDVFSITATQKLTGGRKMLKFKNSVLAILCLVLLLASAAPAAAQEKKKKEKKTYTGAPVLWREPADIESRNLLLGAGGEAMKPDISRVTFLEDKPGGYSKKYRVKDAAGNEWVAKIGKESQPDTAANRLLWAVGYETEVAYLVPKLTIEGKGSFENVRLEARPKSIDRTGNWQWATNPFLSKPEFQGLKVMMALINNWDLKDDNNEILATRNALDSEQRYIISDLGGSFGKTGGFFSRSRNEPSDYVKAEFVKAVKGNLVDFNYGGKNQKLFEGVTVEDAKWMGSWLSRLSDEQIKDAFRAANYQPEEVNQLAGAVRERINALSKLSPNVAAN